MKHKQFLLGVLVGYLLVVFIPRLNFRTHMGGS